jgi:hypothetical protein
MFGASAKKVYSIDLSCTLTLLSANVATSSSERRTVCSTLPPLFSSIKLRYWLRNTGATTR